MASFISKRLENPEKIREFLLVPGVKRDERGWHESAHRYIDEVTSLAEPLGEKARRFLNMGIVKEQSDEYKAAAEAYS